MLIGRSFSSATRPVLLSERTDELSGVRGPETGSANWLVKASSLGPQILISCLWRSQDRPIFGPKEVVAVFERRNKCNRPFINPDRLRTTVAIMPAFKSASLITTV